MKRQILLKLTAGLLLQTFLTTHVVADTGLLHKPTAPQILATESLKLNPADIKVSAQAWISETHRGTSDKLLIHIQDVHTNLEAQKNLAKVLEGLIREYGIDLIFVEGGTGDDSLSFLREYATPKVRKRVATRFLESGEISGEEYLDIVSDDRFQLWGIEDPDLYERALKTYADIIPLRDEAIRYLKQIKRRVNWLKPRIFSDDLQAFDEVLTQFHTNELSLSKYQDTLITTARMLAHDMAADSEILELRELEALEDEIDFQKASREKAQLMELQEGNPQFGLVVQPTLTPINFNHLNEAKLLAPSYLKQEQAHAQGTLYPEYQRYLTYLDAYSTLDVNKLMRETDMLESTLLTKLVTNKTEMRLLQISRNLDLLENYFSLRLRPQEFKIYREQRKAFKSTEWTGFINSQLIEHGHPQDVLALDTILVDQKRSIESFYEMTEARDQEFLKRALAKMELENRQVAVLICGGYHTPNLTQLMRAQDVSYVVVAPQVSEETNLVNYEKILLESLASFGAAESTIRGRAASERIAPKIAQALWAQGSRVGLPRPTDPDFGVSKTSGARLYDVLSEEHIRKFFERGYSISFNPPLHREASERIVTVHHSESAAFRIEGVTQGSYTLRVLEDGVVAIQGVYPQLPRGEGLGVTFLTLSLLMMFGENQNETPFKILGIQNPFLVSGLTANRALRVRPYQFTDQERTTERHHAQAGVSSIQGVIPTISQQSLAWLKDLNRRNLGSRVVTNVSITLADRILQIPPIAYGTVRGPSRPRDVTQSLPSQASFDWLDFHVEMEADEPGAPLVFMNNGFATLAYNMRANGRSVGQALLRLQVNAKGQPTLIKITFRKGIGVSLTYKRTHNLIHPATLDYVISQFFVVGERFDASNERYSSGARGESLLATENLSDLRKEIEQLESDLPWWNYVAMRRRSKLKANLRDLERNHDVRIQPRLDDQSAVRVLQLNQMIMNTESELSQLLDPKRRFKRIDRLAQQVASLNPRPQVITLNEVTDFTGGQAVYERDQAGDYNSAVTVANVLGYTAVVDLENMSMSGGEIRQHAAKLSGQKDYREVFRQGSAILVSPGWKIEREFHGDATLERYHRLVQSVLGVQLTSKQGHTIYVFTVRLAPDPQHHEKRLAQLQAAYAYIAVMTPADAQVILTGDFNYKSSTEARKFGNYLRGFVDTYATVNPGTVGLTYSQERNPLVIYPSQRLDFIYSRHAEPLESRIVLDTKPFATDHFGLLSDIAVVRDAGSRALPQRAVLETQTPSQKSQAAGSRVSEARDVIAQVLDATGAELRAYQSLVLPEIEADIFRHITDAEAALASVDANEPVSLLPAYDRLIVLYQHMERWTIYPRDILRADAVYLAGRLRIHNLHARQFYGSYPVLVQNIGRLTSYVNDVIWQDRIPDLRGVNDGAHRHLIQMLHRTANHLELLDMASVKAPEGYISIALPLSRDKDDRVVRSFTSYAEMLRMVATYVMSFPYWSDLWSADQDSPLSVDYDEVISKALIRQVIREFLRDFNHEEVTDATRERLSVLGHDLRNLNGALDLMDRRIRAPKWNIHHARSAIEEGLRRIETFVNTVPPERTKDMSVSTMRELVRQGRRISDSLSRVQPEHLRRADLERQIKLIAQGDLIGPGDEQGSLVKYARNLRKLQEARAIFPLAAEYYPAYAQQISTQGNLWEAIDLSFVSAIKLLKSIEVGARTTGEQIETHHQKTLRAYAARALVARRDLTAQSLALEVGGRTYVVQYGDLGPSQKELEVQIRPMAEHTVLQIGKVIDRVSLTNNDLHDQALRSVLQKRMRQVSRRSANALTYPLHTSWKAASEVSVSKSASLIAESYDPAHDAAERFWDDATFASQAMLNGERVKALPRSIVFDHEGVFRATRDDEGVFVQSGFMSILMQMERLRKQWLLDGTGDGRDLMLVVYNDQPLKDSASRNIISQLQKIQAHFGFQLRYVDDERLQNAQDSPDVILRENLDLGRTGVPAVFTFAYTAEARPRVAQAQSQNFHLLELPTPKAGDSVLSFRALGMGFFFFDTHSAPYAVSTPLMRYLHLDPSGILILRLLPFDLNSYLDSVKFSKEADSSV